ncbi:DNA ligase (NAD+) [Mycoplasma testudineum]|uniref:DNA ligase n=1 Tax=Mycoplasma testudineum TaxID=244584 RepID=A0A4V3C386_9MOLU|nr:NAD-dependent DNA ligase LigA [Mycoplasma testudineum]OYD27109.1 DNA ligase (NAD(+)) LigA [Mycoplasma testudineum]TDO21139.1 DNA ligase (NAD+) [Mycoplasma testudineum]
MESTEKIKIKIKKINDDILKWDHHYFNLEQSLVSDSEYDYNLWELFKLKEKYPELFADLKDDATLRVGSKVLENSFKKVAHLTNMGSLNKAHNWNHVEDFLNKVEKITNDFKIVVQDKIDGLSISLHYKNGFLVSALTRGDGKIGEDVTSNVRWIDTIPQQINYKNDIEFRGEIYMPISSFNSLNEQSGYIFANPRNAASGTLRQKDSRLSKERKLAAFIYEVVSPEKHNLATYTDAIEFIQNLKFKTTTINIFNNNEKQSLKNFIENYDRNSVGDFQIDGLVLKVNDFSIYSDLGSTSKFSHSAIAYKFDAIVATTKLIDIFPSVGRTGIITYNAKLNPVALNGTIVSAATLHNYEYIKELNLNIGDEVNVIKAGEIIPKVIGLTNKKENIDIFQKSKLCPSCNFSLVEFDSLVDQFCTNKNCPEQLLQKFVYFVSKGGMNIVSLGQKRLEFLIKNKFIENFSDLYLLEKRANELIEFEGWGEKSIGVILEQITKSKSIGAEKVLAALGIKNFGVVGAKTLVEELVKKGISSFSELSNFDFNSLESINNFGPVMIESLQTFFSDDQTKELLLFLDSNNFVFYIHQNLRSMKFDKLSFVFTGTLSKSRSEYSNLVNQNGGKILTSLSKNTSYLVLGENPGSKLEKAKSLGIKIITEDEFNKLIE